MTSDENISAAAEKRVRALIPRALRLDRRYARQRLAGLRGRSGKAPEERTARLLADLADRLERSAAIKRIRYDDFPAVTVNPGLPIAARQADIIAAVRENPVVIVSGATGSGKTTQIPKMCVAAGLGRDGRIGCTQPRRIAAVTIARRIAAELGTIVGAAVGYKIRFSDKTADRSLIKIMTDGILLTEAQHDPRLDEYDALVIDEAHERSLNIDFILGLVKTILPRRPDLKVIITSATIDTEKFSAAFAKAPVIEVSGTLYPVTVRYLSSEDGKSGHGGENGPGSYVEQAVAAVDDILAGGEPGDVLVFMPTAQDIRETCRTLSGRRYPSLTVLPLFAQLPADRQESVFKKHRGRKIIVATNIAETSLTVPGIRYVVDTGLARIPYYNPRTRVTSLAVRRISRSSALQRQGRCGRVSDGVCLRLYSEKDFSKRHLFTPPEILRANLAEVILRMLSLSLGDIRRFPFVDPPMEKSITDGFEVLYELGAITATDGRASLARRLTPMGTLMARIPVDPRLARILIEAARSGCLDAALVIAAALSIQDPRESPPDREKEARAAVGNFVDPDSDFLTLLNIWEAAGNKDGADLRKFCRDCFLSAARVREWRDIYAQLKDIVADQRLPKPQVRPVDRRREPERFYEILHRAILSGYLSNIAERQETGGYAGTRSREETVFPGSALAGGQAAWIVSAELVETTRLYARTVARVERQWIREVAGDLCRMIYINPRWSREQGQATADRQIVLFGLVVGFDTDVPFGPDNPGPAADLFIRHALVRGEVDQPPGCLRHNQNRIAQAVQLEDRLRRKDYLATEDELFAFFRQGLEEDVYSLAGLRKYIRRYGDKRLRLKPADVLRGTPDGREMALFPDAIQAGDLRLSLSYRFDPADASDGVTVHVPAPSAAEVAPAPLDWLVPGLLPEKITALLKGLPKAYRKKLVPLNQTVAVIIAEMPRQDRPLIMTLSDFISRRFGVDIPGAAWQPERLPDYLRMRLAIVDADGQAVSASRDSDILQQVASPDGDDRDLAELRGQWEKAAVDHRDFPDVPVEIPLPGRRGAVYPGLEPHGSAVRLRLFRSRTEALAAHRRGVRRLLEKRLNREVGFLKHDLRLSSTAAGQALYLGGAEALAAGMAEKILSECFGCDIRGPAEFEALAADVPKVLYQRARELKQIVEVVVAANHQTRQALAGLRQNLNPAGEVARELAKMQQDVAALLPDDFIVRYDQERLAQLPRYLHSLGLRARRAVDNFPGHCQKADKARWAIDALTRLSTSPDPAPSPEKRREIDALFWMVEEYKLSVFTQEIKTAGPVSRKRLEEKIREIDRLI